MLFSIGMKNSTLCIVCSDASLISRAQSLAEQTGLPLLDDRSDEYDLQLCFDSARIELFDTTLNTAIYVDFIEGSLAHRQRFGGGRGQAIARAVGLKKGNTPTVLDITAGLARDAFILACLGCRITLVEQSPVLYTLIEDGIRRGLVNAAAASILRNFMNLVHADSVSYMRNMDRQSRPEVIFIDPMYPERKKSALVKKDMQILQRLIGKDENASQLLKSALECATGRVVVKRPVHAAPVNDIKPGTSISSKKTRYDVYLVNG